MARTGFFASLQPSAHLVDGLWKWLKSDVINNVLYHAVSEIRKNVGQFMDEIMKRPTIPFAVCLAACVKKRGLIWFSCATAAAKQAR